MRRSSVVLGALGRVAGAALEGSLAAKPHGLTAVSVHRGLEAAMTQRPPSVSR